MSKLLSNLAFTVCVTEPFYTFQVELNDWAVEDLKRETLLGFKFQKNKYKFAEELSELLAQEIAECLLEMERKV